MKAADIADSVIYEVLMAMPWEHGADRTLSLSYESVEAVLPQYPKKILRAKLQQMRNKGRIAGDVNGAGRFYLTASQVMQLEAA